ncbi:hypothetical protein [Oceanobacillus bengalensis]|uniref:Sporulation protein n=1 Tax=Oceanobacillus bengalensis TaxID=1435466 RepID=A0A494Z1M8_9BACI|nr:hypothetical protein [Oceanobacillus bengalensis]RKQ16384.1 hypothetical protein D8M05_07845 [Oceanobacillus bengalensis]
MHKTNLSLFVLLLLALLIGCDGDSTTQSIENKGIDVRNISVNNMIDQTPSNKAKKILEKHDEVIGIKAANTSEDMIVSVEIKHSKRFTLKKITKELSNKLKDTFSDYHVELSIDKKIFLELEKLEEKIQKKSISKKEVEEEIKRITKLSKEQT